MTVRKFPPLVFLPLLLLATFLIYQPGLQGDFLFDDGPNILNNTAVKITSLSGDSLIQAALSGTSGDLKRPISMLSFGINHALSGLNPHAFKLTNLIIHLMVGASLYLLTILLLRALRETREIEIPGEQWLPLVVSAAWLLHPLNLTPVLYIVQRMTSLETLFTVWGLILFLWGRLRMLHGTRHGFSIVLAGLFICGALATFSKENGVLLPLYMFVIEISLLGFRAHGARGKQLLIGLYVIALALPLLAFLVVLGYSPDRFLGGYQILDFNLYERLLTETRVLWFYLIMLITPNTSMMGIFHDDFPISHGLLAPATTLLSCLGLIALIASALLLRRRAPMLSLGILFFFAGHSLESTIIPLQLVHEHRNYLPSYGILLAGFYYLIHGLEALLKPGARWLIATCAVALFAVTTGLRAEQWSNIVDHTQYEVAHHPLSASANFEMGRIYDRLYGSDPKHNEQLHAMARQYFSRSVELDKNSTQGLFGMIISSEFGKEIPADKWIDEAAKRLATKPMSAVNATSMGSYIKCQYEKKCRINPAATRILLQAALSNPTTAENGLSKAYIESTASLYYALAAPNPELAISYARAASRTLPKEIQYKINLANILIAAEKFDEASALLHTALKMDHTGAYALRIAAQEEFLAQTKHGIN